MNQRKSITESDWIDFFPFDTPRKEQIISINEILNSFINDDKKFFILDAPIGIGKSAIAITVGRYISKYLGDSKKKSTYIVTTQKILQEQYKKDFPDISNISAKSNYICRKRVGVTCDIGSIINKIFNKKNTYTCTYDIRKHEFKNSDISLTNLHYFLNYFSSEDVKNEERKMLVIDECHNLENVITGFVSLNFTKYFVQRFLKISWPNVRNISMPDFIKWVKNSYIKQFESEVSQLKSKMEKSDASFLESDRGISLVKTYDDNRRKLDSIKDGLNFYNENTWIMNVSPTEDVVELKPIYASDYTNNLLYTKCDKILLMSSTILNKKFFCEYNGIPLNDVGYISLESPFPAKNRPINVFSIGSMNKNNIENSLPIIVSAIKEIINHHENDKGIIHCHTYNIANFIKKEIKSDRLLLHKTEDRIETLRQHIISKKSTILLSPSFTEGVDLFDELSRFQIIVKVPFPYLGDNYIRTKKDKIPGWYEWMTVKGLIQSYGRSIRDYDDYAETYILDKDFNWFYNKNKSMFPQWYIEAIKF